MSVITEDEAKTKWCPHVRDVHSDGGVSGTYTSSNYGSRCIGSKCMAWRWTQKRNPEWKPQGQMFSFLEQHPDDKEPYTIPDMTRGFCGLAGRP